MLQITEYDIVIFDCDGVVLDSNTLKIGAMRIALELEEKFSNDEVDESVQYFSNNFGKSRYHHINYFLDNTLHVRDEDKPKLYNSILSRYSEKTSVLYMNAPIIPGVIDFLEKISAVKYIASGSDQNELRAIFAKRKLDKYFNDIYGSPKLKGDIVRSIKERNIESKILMVGDSVSDYEASRSNGIDFIYFSPYSTSKEAMDELCIKKGIYKCDDLFTLYNK